MTSSCRRTLAAALWSAALTSTAAAQAPAGGEFQVNTSTAGRQLVPRVAADPQGRFVVVWLRDNLAGPTPTNMNIVARRFDADAVAQGSEFVVNTYTARDYLSRPSVAFEASGGFIVVFSRRDYQPNIPVTILARRYDAAGAPRGPEFLVETVQGYPEVSAGSGGGFVVAWWESGSIRAKLYDSAANPIGTALVGAGEGPAVTMTPDGGFVVAWSVHATPYTVLARLFDAAGAPRGPAFPVVSGGEFKAKVGVACDAAGNFTVTWQDGVGPMVRRFDANGNALAPEFPVNLYRLGIQGSPAVTTMPNGNAVVTWTSSPVNVNCLPIPFPCPPLPPQDGSGSGVFGRFLDASGTPAGGEFQVNQYTDGEQDDPSVAADAAGRFVAAWRDPLRNGIFARRFYGGLLPEELAVDRVPGPVSNGNGVLEAGETVEVEPAWRNATTIPVAYPTATATFTGPAGPTYTLPDPTATYGTFPANASLGCRDQGDCYQASVTGSRPVEHWDAVLTESLAAGPTKPWLVHVGGSFADVPASSLYYRFIETLLHRGVTAGCTGTTYCPTQSTTREQMAVFVLVAKEGAGYTPASCVPPNLFNDVPETSPFCRYIEELANRGVVGGCAPNQYCGGSPVTREQMAVFVLRTLDPTLDPPACAPPNMFGDMPETSPFCRWVEELARRGIVAGCGGGNYCGSVPVTREQMGVFLGVTFGLTLYGL